MNNIGWVRIHRKIIEWEWYTDINTTRLFTHLLFTVNYEPKRWKGIDINPGQRVFGLHKLSQECGLSVQQTRTCLERLKSTNEITIKSTNKFSLLTIEKWEEYQPRDGESTSYPTNKQQTNNKQITTTKERKKERSKEEGVKIRHLDDLEVSHISDWLESKRKQGEYINHNPAEVLEIFKDYCKSSGKKYKDYVAAYRLSFKWDKCQPKRISQPDKPPEETQGTEEWENKQLIEWHRNNLEKGEFEKWLKNWKEEKAQC